MDGEYDRPTEGHALLLSQCKKYVRQSQKIDKDALITFSICDFSLLCSL